MKKKKRLEFLLFFILMTLFNSCNVSSKKEVFESNAVKKDPVTQKEITLQQKVIRLFNDNPDYLANSFDYPVGKPNAKGYYNAQGFGKTAI